MITARLLPLDQYTSRFLPSSCQLKQKSHQALLALGNNLIHPDYQRLFAKNLFESSLAFFLLFVFTFIGGSFFKCVCSVDYSTGEPLSNFN